MSKKLSYYNQKIDRHIKLDIENEDSYLDFERLGKALASPIRIAILKHLKRKSMNIVEIAETLEIPVSSTAFHVKTLEDADLIVTETMPGIRGSQRVCSASAEDIFIAVNVQKETLDQEVHTTHMPIGYYSDCEVHPTCGLVDTTGYIEVCDNPRAFYSPRHVEAQLIWFQKGYVEYRFPNYFLENCEPSSISFSLEFCSEAPGYRNVWPSDITFSINGSELISYTSPGDFGGRHGKLTPAWWTDGNTQFGLLKTIFVNADGVRLDEQFCSNSIRLSHLGLRDHPYISFRVEIKPDARHIGGINLFGGSFGDHAQDIVMHIVTM